MKQTTSRKIVRWGALAALAAGLGAGFGWRADAARTVSVSPQGTSPLVSQAVVKFDEPMVAFGSAAQPDPAHLSCNDAAAAKYDASWSDARTWLVNFRHDLPPGVSCTLELNEGLRSVAGHAVSGPRRFTFQTGGPYPAAVRPGGGRIEERQLFVLKLTGPAPRPRYATTSGARPPESATAFRSRSPMPTRAASCSIISIGRPTRPACWCSAARRRCRPA